jgi:hypothetical protein
MSAPSGYTALDFVGFTDKGTYSPIVKYMRNDLVHHGGNIMRCKVDDTLNVTPVEGANWELWIGASANLAERTIAPLENNPADVAFGVGRQIIYDDWLWEVIAPIAVGDALIDYAVDPTNANIKKSAPVETQLLAVKAEADATDNMIAPTEANASSSSAAYSVGDQLILNNILYDVIAAIQIGDALTTGTGGNIEEADTLADQLAAKANRSELATIDSSIQTLEDNDDAMLNVLGAKNLLPNNATTQTINEVTFTVNSDGSVTANGTATSAAVLTLCSNWGGQLTDGKQYILSGCPTQSSVGYRIDAFGDNTSLIQDTGSGAKFTSNGDSLTVRIVVNANATVNATFYPMIRPSSIKDDTYAPYAMTNRELTEKSPIILYESTGDTGLKSLDIDLSEWAIVLLMIRFASTKCNSPVILIPGQSFTVGTPTELNNGEVVNERYCAYGHSSTSNITIDEIGYFSSANNWQSRKTGTLAVNYGLFKVIGLIRR